MKFPTPSAEEIPAAPQIVLNLIDHLSRQGRSSLRAQQEMADVEFWSGRDGWLVARVHESWSQVDVLLKRDSSSLQYQCSCPTFRMDAPIPCAHVALVALYACDEGVLEGQNELSMLPGSRTKPLSPARPVAQITDDGSICLLRKNGQPVLQAKPSPLP